MEDSKHIAGHPKSDTALQSVKLYMVVNSISIKGIREEFFISWEVQF